MRQFLVRILRDTDEDYADVVVDADDEASAKETALSIVRANPDRWFDYPPQPKYVIDPSSDVEDVTGGEYASANEVRP
ncbi:hypothetical protein [Brucella anthropi]|uniref:hypothetical protein n=1 Tax=Brucella anthropi TaxID=529 RepID=UPI00384F6487